MFAFLWVLIALTLSSCEQLNTPHFTWSITDSLLIEEILITKNRHSFESAVFELNSFKWFIRLGKFEDGFNQVMIALVLATLPYNIINITCQPTFEVIETNTKYEFTKIVDYQQGVSYRWGKTTLHTKSIQKISTLTINIYTNIINAYDMHENIISITKKQIIATIPKSTMHFSYLWSLSNDLRKIKKAKPSYDSIWISPQFGGDLFFYRLEFFPNGYPEINGRVLLFIQFNCLHDEIGYVFIKYRLYLIECNVEFTYQRLVTIPMDPFGWYKDTMLNDQILNVDNITISCDIDVIEIYDKQHNIITDYYAYIEDDGYNEDEEYIADEYGHIAIKDGERKKNIDQQPVDEPVINTIDDITDNESEGNNVLEIDKKDAAYFTMEIVDKNESENVFLCDNVEGICCHDEDENCHRNENEVESETNIIDDINNQNEATFILKLVLVIYCAGFHCTMFAIFQKINEPSMSVHCFIAFLYYFCLFFIDSLWNV